MRAKQFLFNQFPIYLSLATLLHPFWESAISHFILHSYQSPENKAQQTTELFVSSDLLHLIDQLEHV